MKRTPTYFGMTKNRIARISLALCLGSLLGACTETKLLIANTLASQDIPISHTDLSYGSNERQKLDLHLPEITVVSGFTKPTIVFIPGGCWGACKTFPKDDYLFLAEGFIQQGYPVAILNYRLYPDYLYGEQIQDVSDAIKWIDDNGSRYKLNENILLMGHSAGAHLAAMINFDERLLTPSIRSKLSGFIGLAGPYDFLPFTEDYQPTLFGPETKYKESQPIEFVDGSEPPSLLLYGLEDSSVKAKNIINLDKKIKDKEGSVLTLCYPGVDHGGIVGALSKFVRQDQTIFDDIIDFAESKNIQRDTRQNECSV